MKLFMMFLVALGGAGIALQAPINATLRRAVESPALSAFISFATGALFLALLTLSGVLGRGRIDTVNTLPWWAWIGGVLGTIYVTASIIAVPRIGAGVVIASVILGQLVMAMIIDANGWFGVPQVALSPSRLIGALLLFVGVFLMQRH